RPSGGRCRLGRALPPHRSRNHPRRGRAAAVDAGQRHRRHPQWSQPHEQRVPELFLLLRGMSRRGTRIALEWTPERVGTPTWPLIVVAVVVLGAGAAACFSSPRLGGGALGVAAGALLVVGPGVGVAAPLAIRALCPPWAVV